MIIESDDLIENIFIEQKFWYKNTKLWASCKHVAFPNCIITIEDGGAETINCEVQSPFFESSHIYCFHEFWDIENRYMLLVEATKKEKESICPRKTSVS